MTRKLAAVLGAEGEAEAMIAGMDGRLTDAARAPTHLRVAAWDGGGYAPGAGTLSPKYFSTMATVRLTRLPRSLARSALMRLSSAS